VADIITDSALIEQFTKKAMEEPEVVIKTKAPSEPEVKLPGGLIENGGEIIKTAEVRELTGADEEAISRAGSVSKSAAVLLQRGLVKLGSREATKDDLDNLLSGDRDAILLGIRKVTFGNIVQVNAKCPSCSTTQVVDIDLVDDVPVKSLEDSVRDRTWVVDTNMGPVQVGLPTGLVQKKLIENSDKTSAEMNTLLLAGCIISVNDRPSSGASTALSLGIADRQKVVDSIIERNPGPRLGEVKKACQACGEDIELPLSLLDLFRL